MSHDDAVYKNESLKSILKKQSHKRHVQFGEIQVIDENEPSTTNSATTKETVNSVNVAPEIPIVLTNKIPAGKAHPIRDLCILLAVVGIMMFCTRDFQLKNNEDEDMDTPMKSNPIPMGNTINGAASGLKALFSAFQKNVRKRTESCSTFLHMSHIPGTGYSLYAGVEYNEGDVVLPDLGHYFPPPRGDGAILLSSYAFLLKPHPQKYNVKGSLFVNTTDLSSNDEILSGQLTATRTIAPGEELFVSYQIHPLTQLNLPLFRNFPQQDEYALAHEILADTKLTAKRMAASHRKKSIRFSGERFFLSLMKRSISKFNPRVAAMITETTERTLDHHRWNSTCVQDIGLETGLHGGTTIVSTRKFFKHETIAVVPMYIIYEASDIVDREVDSVEGDVKEHSCANANAIHDGQCVVRTTKATAWEKCIRSTGDNHQSNMTLCPLTIPIGLLDTSDTPNVKVEWAASCKGNGCFEEGGGMAALKIVAMEDINIGKKVSLPAYFVVVRRMAQRTKPRHLPTHPPFSFPVHRIGHRIL